MVIYHRVFNIPHYFPVHNEAEVIVDISNCKAAIRELQKVVDDYHIPLNYLTEVSTCFYTHTDFLTSSAKVVSYLV